MVPEDAPEDAPQDAPQDAAILVAIGANLPGPSGEAPVETCRRAVLALSRLPGLRLEAVSRWYRSAPVPPSGQPDYVNGVALLSASGIASRLDPVGLLRDLHGIEHEFGRVRGERNAARTLDLDLIAIGGLVRDTPDPVLPHPRAHQRAFVLLPLQEVAPDWVEPRRGRPVSDLLAELRESCGGGDAPLDWPVPYR